MSPQLGSEIGCIAWFQWLKGGGAMTLAVVCTLLSGGVPALGAAPGYERQPVLQASQLAPAELLQGPGFHVDAKVPTDGFLGRYIIRSEVGTFEAHGREMLRIRVAELGAIKQLEAVSKTETFAKALGSTAMCPVKASPTSGIHPPPSCTGGTSRSCAIWTFEARVRALMRNPWYSLTVLTACVTTLEQLQEVSGRDSVVTFAASTASEDQARFIAESLQMLAHYHQTITPMSVVVAIGPIAARDRNGVLMVPAPVDYVAWTPRVAELARHPDLKAQQPGVWLTGQLSPRARRELAPLGWTVHEDVQRPAPQSAAR